LVQLEDPTIRADINIFYVNHKIATGFKEHIPALDRILKTAKKEGKKILVYFEDAVLDPFHTRKEFELYFPEFDMNRVASDSLYEEAFAKFYPFYLDYKDEQLNSQDVLLRFKDVEGDDFELSYLHFFAQKIMDERYPLEMHYERPPFEYIRFIVQTAIERERCGKSGDEFLAVIAFLAERNMYLVNKRDEKLFADITARIKALRDESCVFIIRGVKHQYLEVLFLEAGYATTSFVGEKIMKEYEDMIKDSLWEEDPLRQLEQVRRLKDKRRNNVLRKSVYDFVRHPVIEILRKWHIFGGLLAIGISFLLWWRYQREKKIKQIINETSKKSDDSISKNNRGSLTSSPIVFQQTQGFASLASSPIEENVKSKDLTPSMQCPAVNLENTKKDVLNSFYCGRSEVSQFKGREVSKRERNKNNISLTKGCHRLDLPGSPRNQRSFLQPLKGGGHPQKSLKGEANLAEVVFVLPLLVAKSPALLSQEYPYSLIAPLKKDTIFLSNLSSILSSEDDTASSPIIKNRDRDRYSASSPVDVTRRDFLKRILGSAGAVVLGTSAITQGRVVASGNGGQRKKMAVLISGYSQIIRYLNLFVFNTYARFYFKSQGVDIHIIDDARRNDLRRVLGDSTIHYVAVVGEGGWSHWMATDGTVFENDIAEWESERKINKKELFIRYTCGKRDWDETGGYCPYEGIIEELIPVYDIPLDKADVVKRMLEAEKIEIGSIGCRWGKRDDGAYVAKSAVMYVLKKDAWPTDEYLKAKLKSLGLRESRYSYDEGQVEGFSITEHHK
ncbi:MAG: twin-arginine translocation signal domain-containing protein, partial [Candidatus Omnitrophota bacterium]